ncbi:hypothetical protein AYO40_00345 [Planctomycetaceae bacterium SCGC AG-212-D15]|nr:hypothetical protein AYO40_00345 [Planctomycetaceae bacterium SCGC AG-212-D15]
MAKKVRGRAVPDDLVPVKLFVPRRIVNSFDKEPVVFVRPEDVDNIASYNEFVRELVVVGRGEIRLRDGKLSIFRRKPKDETMKYGAEIAAMKATMSWPQVVETLGNTRGDWPKVKRFIYLEYCARDATR